MVEQRLRIARLAVEVLIAVLLVIVIVQNLGLPRSPSLSGGYHAVVLTTGQVYFGKVQQADSPHPVMTDVYYVQTRTNPETKAANPFLVKRGKEWHGPDRMILNAEHILFIEPVGSGSTVAKLIEESKKE